jgi:hypothetical protein
MQPPRIVVQSQKPWSTTFLSSDHFSRVWRDSTRRGSIVVDTTQFRPTIMHVTALLAAAAFASSVHAWGTLGHQTVALLAQQYLLPETISSVQEILNDTTPIYMGRTALWADQYRLTPEGKFSAPFHFIDGRGTPPGTCGVTMSDCPEEGCAVSAIANYVSRPQIGVWWTSIGLTDWLFGRHCDCRTNPLIRYRGSRLCGLSSM